MFEDPTMANLDAKLVETQAKLKLFEGVDNGTKLARLRDAVPNHPFLLMRTVGFGGSISFLVILVLAFVAPMVDPKVARTLASVDVAAGLPLPVVLLGIIFGLAAMGIAGHQLGVLRAQTAPLLPEERKLQQQLVQDMVRIQAKKDLAAKVPKKTNPMLE